MTHDWKAYTGIIPLFMKVFYLQKNLAWSKNNKIPNLIPLLQFEEIFFSL